MLRGGAFLLAGCSCAAVPYIRIGVHDLGAMTSVLSGFSPTRAVHLQAAALVDSKLIVGAVLGAVVGWAVASFFTWLARPRVRHYGFVKRDLEYEGGSLYKLWFELEGRAAPGLSTLELRCKGRSRFAKWDETGISAYMERSVLAGHDPRRCGTGAPLPAHLRCASRPRRRRRFQLFSGWW